MTKVNAGSDNTELTLLQFGIEDRKAISKFGEQIGGAGKDAVPGIKDLLKDVPKPGGAAAQTGGDAGSSGGSGGSSAS